MKLFANLLIPILMIGVVSNVLALDEKYYSTVEPVINAFKSENKRVISALIEYPINRRKPLEPIRNETEFLARFDEVFDEKLMSIISNSKKEEDWNSVGWRGLTLKNGLIWINSTGKITAINYESSTEENIKEELIKKQKLTLHKSIRSYKEPVLEWKTKKFHIRIDEVENNNYRYTSWSLSKKTSVRPDIVLFSNVVVFDGSGGNHHFVFKSGKYKYLCYINRLGTNETPPGSIEVFKEGELLLSDPVIEVL